MATGRKLVLDLVCDSCTQRCIKTEFIDHCFLVLLFDNEASPDVEKIFELQCVLQNSMSVSTCKSVKLINQQISK